MEQESLLTKIIDFIFGRKYYAVIINRRGTGVLEISSYIHRNKEAVERYKERLANNMAYLYVETVSFRSRKEY